MHAHARHPSAGVGKQIESDSTHFGSSLFQPLGFRYKRERKALRAVCAHDRKIEGDARPWLVVAKAMNFSAIAPRLAHFVPLQMMEPRLFFLGVRGLRLH
jgi:hypothetical protein